MILDAFLEIPAFVPVDDGPNITTFFDLEQFQGATNQSDNADQQMPLDRWLNLVVDTTFNECTTMLFSIITDDAVSFDTGPTLVPGGTTGPIGVATLVSGYVIMSVNIGLFQLDRYLSIQNTKGGSTETTGKIQFFIGAAPIGPLNTQKFPT